MTTEAGRRPHLPDASLQVIEDGGSVLCLDLENRATLTAERPATENSPNSTAISSANSTTATIHSSLRMADQV
jgi:hypothetical protein